MRNYLKLLCVVMIVVLLSGCATIMTGPTQKVQVISDPSGAVAKLDGATASVTPTIFTLDRKVGHVIEISKEGYRSTQIILKQTLSGAFFGNIIIGGIIGIVVDFCTGAMYKVVPEKVNVTLVKEGSEGSSIEAPKVTEVQTSATVAK